MKQTMQMKRLLVVVILLATITAILFSVTAIAFAQPLDNDDFDTVFIETAKELNDIDTKEITLTANKEVLLDIQLKPLGYVYDFTVNDENGFAILILLDGDITVTEFALGNKSPYNEINGSKVYVGYLTYLYELDGDFYAVGGGNKLSDELIEKLSEKAYKAAGDITYSKEEIIYTSKNVNKKNLAFRHPYITEVGGLSNACAPIAGANLIQYWDRFCENLIPNYTPYTILSNQYIYKGDSVNLHPVVETLYVDMATGVNNAGTTETQFKNGLKIFCNRQGYSISYNSCMSNRKFNYNLAKQRLEAGQPLAIFVDTFTVADISESETDFIAYLNGNGCHVMAGFGYKEISYTLNNGSTRNDYYIAVASGYSMYSRTFYNINLNTVIDDVFGVVIS